jgi:hypothetical protein
MALKGLPTLDIDIEALSIQLYNTSSFQTSIELFTNSSYGEEKTNLILPEELPSRTLTKKVTHLRKVYKIKYKFQLKDKRIIIQ